MKTPIAILTLLLAGVGSTHAQMYQPASTVGAVLGAITGAFVGGHNHDRWGEGAAIGGLAGALLGSAVAPQTPVYGSAPRVYQNAQVAYGQQQAPYSQVVPGAPYVQGAPYVNQGSPQVVYVESAPRVVYVPAPPAYYVAPPAFGYGFGYYSGPRYYSPGYYAPRNYSHNYGHRR